MLRKKMFIIWCASLCATSGLSAGGGGMGGYILAFGLSGLSTLVPKPAFFFDKEKSSLGFSVGPEFAYAHGAPWYWTQFSVEYMHSGLDGKSGFIHGRFQPTFFLSGGYQSKRDRFPGVHTEGFAMSFPIGLVSGSRAEVGVSYGASVEYFMGVGKFGLTYEAFSGFNGDWSMQSVKLWLSNPF
jgi:hypothetical protein